MPSTLYSVHITLYYKHMRINRFIAAATGVSRRQADKLITGTKVYINGLPAKLTDHVTTHDKVFMGKEQLFLPAESCLVMLNKPVGYVCSRNGQGSKTVYDLLPIEFHHLKPVGRLDKDSSGLLLLTDDGQLAHELTHPKFSKDKVYKVDLTNALSETDQKALVRGVQLEDGISKLDLVPLNDTRRRWQVTIAEGRNRQIRRTFSALGYTVNGLHRTQFGEYYLDSLQGYRVTKVID